MLTLLSFNNFFSYLFSSINDLQWSCIESFWCKKILFYHVRIVHLYKDSKNILLLF